MQMAEYKHRLKLHELLAKKTWQSHDITVLNPDLNIDLHINMKLPLLIQATCQTVDLDTWAAETLADEKTMSAHYSRS